MNVHAALGVRLLASLVFTGGALFGAERTASAALTASEKGQIRDFVASAQVESALRVRALVARTDLTHEETLAVLAEAVAPVPFSDARGVFLRELVFGSSSSASRPLLAHAVTHALLARADIVYQRAGSALDQDARGLKELAAIYAFLDTTIANAGRPARSAHDASAGIAAAAYDACAKELGEHIEKNARWLKGDGLVPESVGRVRAQAQVALVDMLPDGLTRYVDAAVRLGLKGTRRKMLADWGILLQDTGKLDEAKAERVQKLLARWPDARADLSLVYAGEERGALQARGVSALAGAVSAAGAEPFSDDSAPPSPVVSDALWVGMVHDLSVLAVKRALDRRVDLKQQSEKDVVATMGGQGRKLGKPRAPSVEHVVAAAVQLLELDAPRAVDFALSRVLQGRSESAALLSDAVGVLATASPEAGTTAATSGLTLELGNGDAAGTVRMTLIKLAPTGAATSFTIAGHTWAIERSAPNGAVSGVTRDGRYLSAADFKKSTPSSARPK